MSFLKANSNENFNIKFLELRKLKLCDNEINDSVNSVAVSHRHRLIFASHDNCVKIIKEDDLLNFEWSKKVINEVVETFPHSTVTFNFTPFLLTTSGGLNNILVVFGVSPSNELKVEFFEVNSLANNNFVSFATLNLPENIARGNKVVSVDWHPEFAESLFVAVLTNGMLISVGVNLDARNAQMLAQYLTNHKITCVCWSPKGKQLVAGKINGSLVQLKHVNGTSFQEAKTIAVPQEFPSKVLSVKWVLSSMFIVIYVDDMNENDPITKYASVFAPPKKQPVFYDFGPVCLNALPDETSQVYSVEFCQIGDLVLCLSSLSSEVGVIGADGAETTLPTSWSQFTLEDNARIELPLSKAGLESFPRGVTFFRTSPKAFRISETEMYGGEHCPLLIILTSTGILCPYYVINKSKPFTLQTPSVTQLPYEIKQISAHQPPSSVISQQPQQLLTPKPQPLLQQSINTAPLPKQVEVQRIESAETIQPNIEAEESQRSTEPSVVESGESEKELSLRSKEALQQQLEESCLIALKEEIIEFDNELKTQRQRFSEVYKLAVGTADEKQDLITRTKETEEFLKEIKDLHNNLDMDTMQGFVLESFAMAEDARCRVDRNVDARYKKILSKRALNPKMAKRMKKMDETAKYIELQLREVNNVLDQEWRERVEKKKPLRDPSDYEIIVKLLANNRRTVAAMKRELDKLESQSPKSRKTFDRNTKEEISKLVKSMSKAHLDESIEDEVTEEEEKVVYVKTLSADKKKKLWDFLEQRSSVPVVKAMVPVDVKSSRFVSAVVKAQQTLQIVQEKKEKLKTPSMKPQSKPVQQVAKPTPAKATVTPTKTTVVTKPPVKASESVPKTTGSFQAIQTTVSSVTKSSSLQTPKATVVASPKPLFPKQVTSVTTPAVTIKPSETTSNVTTNEKTVSPVKDNNGNIRNYATNTTPVKATEPNIGDTAPKMTVSSPFSFSTVEKSNVLTPKPLNLAESASSFSTPKFSTPFTTASTSQFGQPFKFGLQAGTSFSFISDNKGGDETETAPKYEDVTPPTSPDPKKDEQKIVSATPEKIVSVEGETIKPVQFSFKSKSQELKAAEKSAEQKPAGFTITVSKTSESTVSSSSDKVKAAQTVFPPADLSVTATSVAVATAAVSAPASTVSTTIITPVPSKPVQTSESSTTSATGSFITSPVFTPASQPTSPVPLFEQSASIQSQSSAFGATTPISAANTTVFGQNTATANKVASPFSPVSTESQFPSSFSFCNLGGKPNPENVNKNPFGSGFAAVSQSPSIFGAQPSTVPAFGSTNTDTTGSGSFTCGSGVAQTGFGGFQQTPPKFGGFGAAPAFGSSPSFGGGAVFGGSPNFGGSPVFGSTPAFGSSPTFQQPTQPTSFSGFASSSELPTFGAIASQQPTFGSMPQQNEPQSFGAFSQGFGGFGSNTQFASPQFSQRRQ